MHKKKFFVFFLLILQISLFAEAVYDSYGNLIRSSSWLPRSTKTVENHPSGKTGEDKKENEEPLLQEMQEMKIKSDVSDNVFTSDEIEKSKSSNLPEFLKQKGFLIMSSGGIGTKTELSYKGFTSFCIKVYIDGILSNNPITGEFDWNSIDMATIESIVITESPQIGISEFAGCSVLITTKGNSKGLLSTESAISSYESNLFDSFYQSINYASSKNKFFYRINSSLVISDNEYFKDLTPNINRYNFSNMANVSFNWNAKINENWSLSGNDSVFYNKVKAFGQGDSLSKGIEEDFTSQNNFTFTFEKENFRSQTITKYFYGQVNYLNDWDLWGGKDVDVTNLQNFAIRENISFLFDLSFGYRQEHLFSNNADRHQLDIGISKEHKWNWFTMTPCLEILFYGPNVNNHTEENYNVNTINGNFQKAISYNLGEGWHAELLPRLTLKFIDWVSVSSYRTLVLPTFNQLYWPDKVSAKGNPSLSAEQGWAATICVKNESFPLFFRFTYSYYENKIRWALVDGKLTPSNTANADYYVGVVGYNQEVWKNHLLLNFDATMTQARLRETKKQIMWVPQYQFHASINFSHSGFNALIDYSFTSKRFKTNENIDFYPSFHLLDVVLSYQINSEFNLYAKGSNLLDQKVVYNESYYIPSRKWTVGFKVCR